MRFFLSVFLCLFLSACVAEQNIQKQLDVLTPNFSTLNPTEKELHGVVITVKNCTLSNTRIATCTMNAMSKYQDRKLKLLGGNYTKIQDDTGLSYPTRIAYGRDATARGQTLTTLIADTPYEFTIMAENISTRATQVRAIEITRMDVQDGVSNHFIGYIKMNFPHPPMSEYSPEMTNMFPSPGSNTATATSKLTAHQNTQPQTGDMPYRYLFTKIVPINDQVPKDKNLANGAYLHLREDGALGHNFSKPGPYGYVPKQSWKLTDNSLIIIFDQISYTFDLTDRSIPMVTYLDQGGLYKMTIYPKTIKQK